MATATARVQDQAGTTPLLPPLPLSKPPLKKFYKRYPQGPNKRGTGL